jgi:hypothetical protein
MSEINSISVFLEESLVDDLWTIARRDGTTMEKVKEAATKVGGKAKFGVGKLWQWMTADMQAELAVEGSGKYSQKIQFSSVFRALMLPDLLDDIARVSSTEGSLQDLSLGGFVEIEADTLELVPLPTFAGYIRQMTMAGAGEGTDEDKSPIDFDKIASFAEKFTAMERALTFHYRANDEDNGPPTLLHRLYNEGSEELFNALCMSKDDHVLALLEFSIDNSRVIVFSVVEERYLKRNLAVFTVKRPVRIFGRVAHLKKVGASDDFIGVEAISISLS